MYTFTNAFIVSLWSESYCNKSIIHCTNSPYTGREREIISHYIHSSNTCYEIKFSRLRQLRISLIHPFPIWCNYHHMFKVGHERNKEKTSQGFTIFKRYKCDSILWLLHKCYYYIPPLYTGYIYTGNIYLSNSWLRRLDSNNRSHYNIPISTLTIALYMLLHWTTWLLVQDNRLPHYTVISNSVEHIWIYIYSNSATERLTPKH